MSTVTGPTRNSERRQRWLQVQVDRLARKLGVPRSRRRALHLLETIADSPRTDFEDITQALGLVELARLEVDLVEVALIERARDAGASWSRIAAGLGLRSRQAAEQRYLRLTALRRSGPAERDPQVARELQRSRRIRDRLIDEYAPLLEGLTSAILADSENNPERWDAAPDPQRIPVMTRLSILRRQASSAPPAIIYALLTDIARTLSQMRNRYPSTLPPSILEGFERLSLLQQLISISEEHPPAEFDARARNLKSSLDAPDH
ncbi:hypothetical protein [Saccharothrix obliqua]|uniref:hypothetical protein n=1 Tax=Saccharothrix obliqua TaxID=2861747 RepID=UPI001C606761|nr:hypothetical protein [Saccharothrix obliqua]MBW4719671.1 hypothetical protein [Saccharothrix obliqua]